MKVIIIIIANVYIAPQCAKHCSKYLKYKYKLPQLILTVALWRRYFFTVFVSQMKKKNALTDYNYRYTSVTFQV